MDGTTKTVATAAVDDGQPAVTVDRKPIITCAGELDVFSGLEDSLTVAIPQDACEWRRPQGRPVRSVHISVRFSPFSAAALPRENQWDLIRHPLFHVYWTECTDLEVYKTSVREDIDGWLRELTARNINDWLVVVVESYDSRRTNKLLPRTTVLDKIRAEFAAKQGDRCISVLSPGRQETRTADSWRGLVARVRHLVLVAYARAVGRLEEHVRQQRERRNEPGWHFLDYFRLQEELAQVLEMLGLHDEALVQYDELNVLLSQFVLNAQLGQAPSWLAEFQAPLAAWHGLRLSAEPLNAQPSLLELRAYLFARQAHVLLLTCRPWEMASRCLPFLHACVLELMLLEVAAPPGAVACWLFLACLEVLHTCERFNDTSQVEAYSLYTADLWAYAGQKLRELGELCGLLPGADLSWRRLHSVVELSAGMGDCPGAPGRPSPTDKLKEALSSKEAFGRHYLELCELAMGTYKHIGRLRSARLVGRRLAAFYRQLGETQKAAAFLGDALATLQQEGWRELAVHTQLELAECHRQAGDARRLVRACAAVAAAPEMDTVVRCAHFDQLVAALPSLDRALAVPFLDVFRVAAVHLRSGPVLVQDAELLVDLELECSLPKELVCTDALVALVAADEPQAAPAATVPADRTPEEGARTPVPTQLQPPAPAPPQQQQRRRRLRMHRHLDYRQDGQVSSASVVCRSSPVRRADSGAARAAAAPRAADFATALRADPSTALRLAPGLNVVRLRWAARRPGRYTLGQAALVAGPLEFLSQRPLGAAPAVPAVEVRRHEPSVRLDKDEAADLLAGLEQTMLLTVTVGSYAVERGAALRLCASRGLRLQLEAGAALTADLHVPLEDTAPFGRTARRLRALADLPARQHRVTVHCPWAGEPLVVPLDFAAPLAASWRLHTALRRKFVQVVVSGRSARALTLRRARLRLPPGAAVRAAARNPPGGAAALAAGLAVSYMWELEPAPAGAATAFRADFSVDYRAAPGADGADADSDADADADARTFDYSFDVADLETLYVIEARVEPTKGNEFCRAGALCHLKLSIATAAAAAAARSLMYEVLAEQSVWAVCGRTAGVVSMEAECAPQLVTLDVMPLTGGFLPLPLVRLSKYIPAEKPAMGKEAVGAHPRLEPFAHGQVYNSSKARQVHVLAAAADPHT